MSSKQMKGRLNSASTKRLKVVMRRYSSKRTVNTIAMSSLLMVKLKPKNLDSVSFLLYLKGSVISPLAVKSLPTEFILLAPLPI